MMAALIPRGLGVGVGVGVRPLLLHPTPVPLSPPSARLPPLLSRFPSLAVPSSGRRRRRLRSPVVVVAAQFDFAKVVQTAYRVGKDVIETGSSFVPESVPRPVARIGVAVLSATLAIVLFKSVISTAFFVLVWNLPVYLVSFITLIHHQTVHQLVYSILLAIWLLFKFQAYDQLKHPHRRTLR